MDFRISRILAKRVRKHSTHYLLALIALTLILLATAAYAAYDSPIELAPGSGPITERISPLFWEVTDNYWADLAFGWDGDGRLEVWEVMLSAAIILLTFGAGWYFQAALKGGMLFGRALVPGSKLLWAARFGKLFTLVEPIRLYAERSWLTWQSHKGIKPQGLIIHHYTRDVFNPEVPALKRAENVFWWAADDLMIYTGVDYVQGGWNLLKLGVNKNAGIPLWKALPDGLRSMGTNIIHGKIISQSIRWGEIPASIVGLATPQGVYRAARIGHICGFFNLPITTAYSAIYRGRLPTIEEYVSGFEIAGMRMPGYRESWQMGTAFGGIMEAFGPVLRPAVQRIPILNRAVYISPESMGSFSKYMEQCPFANRVFSSVMEEMIREQAVDIPSNIKGIGMILYGRGVRTPLTQWMAELDLPFWNETPFVTVGLGELFQESFDPTGKPTLGGTAMRSLGTGLLNLIFGAPAPSSFSSTAYEFKDIMFRTQSSFETYQVRNILADFGVQISDPVKLNTIGKVFTAYGEMGYTPTQAMNYAFRMNNAKINALQVPAASSLDSALSTGLNLKTNALTLVKPTSLNGIIAQTMNPIEIGGGVPGIQSQYYMNNMKVPQAEMPIVRTMASSGINLPSINNMVNAGIGTSNINTFFKTAGPNIFVSPTDAASIKVLTNAGFDMAQIGEYYRGAGHIETTANDIPAIKQLSLSMTLGEIGAMVGLGGTASLNTQRLPLVQEMHAAGFSGAEIGELLNTAGINFQVTKADIPAIKQMHSAGMSMQDIGRLYDLQSIGTAAKVSAQGILPGENVNINSQNVGEIINLHKAGVSIKTIGLMLNTGATPAEISALNAGLGGIEVSIEDASTLKLMMQKVNPKYAGEIYAALQTSAGPAIDFNKVDVALSAKSINLMIDSGVKAKDAGLFLKSAGGNIGLIGKADIPGVKSAIQTLGAENAGKLYSPAGMQAFETNMQTVKAMQTDFRDMKLDFKTEGLEMISTGGVKIMDAYRNHQGLTVDLIKNVGPKNTAAVINSFTLEEGGLNIDGVQNIIGLAKASPEATKILLSKFSPKTVSENSATINKIFTGLHNEAPIFLNKLPAVVLSSMTEADIKIATRLATPGNSVAVAELFTQYYQATGKTLGESNLSPEDTQSIGSLMNALGPKTMAKALATFSLKTSSVAEAIEVTSQVTGQLGIDGLTSLVQSPFFESDISELKTLNAKEVAGVFYKQIAASFMATGILAEEHIESILPYLDSEHRTALFISMLGHETSRLEAEWDSELRKNQAAAETSYNMALELSGLLKAETFSCELIEALLRGDKEGVRKMIVYEILPIIAETKGYVGKELEKIEEVLSRLEIEYCETWSAHYSVKKDKTTLYVGSISRGMTPGEYVAALFALLHECEHLPERISSQNLVKPEQGTYFETGTTEFGEGLSSIMPLIIAQHMYAKTRNNLYKAIALMYHPARMQMDVSKRLDALKEGEKLPLVKGSVMPSPSLAWIQKKYGLGESDAPHVAPERLLSKVLRHYGGSIQALNNDLRFIVGVGEEFDDITLNEAVGILNSPNPSPVRVNTALYNLLQKSIHNGNRKEREDASRILDGVIEEFRESENRAQITDVFESLIHRVEIDYPGTGFN